MRMIDDTLPEWTPEDFADYLSNTLAPDLRDSGKMETAEDFEKIATMLQSGTNADPGFISYLQQLATDSRESGYDATAEDYETAIKLLSPAVESRVAQIVRQALGEAAKKLSEGFSTNRTIDRAVAYLKANGAGPHAEADFRRAAAGMEDHEVIQLFAELADITPEEAEVEIADY